VHIGNLWTTGGALLATATFANETDSGWQQVNFSAPVAVTANTDYVVSYHTNTGHYADDPRYFFTSSDTAPLHAPASSASAPNGVYTYGTGSTFPTSTNGAQNYWVDVVFTTDASPPTVLSADPASGATAIAPSTVVSATFTKPVQGSSVSLVLKDPNNASVPGTLTFNSATSTATLTPFSALNPLTTYTATVSGVLDTSGNAMPSPYSWSFTTTSFAVCPCTVFAPSATPATAATTDTHSVEIGLKFRADANGYVTGIRFYKGATNTGVHTGTLWSSTGQQLATATFSNESASGWQQVNFSSWVPVTANTVYVVSYHAPVGRYSLTANALTNGVDNAPMHALANGASGPNAVFAYATTTTFPTTSGGNANYWVDAVYALSNAAPAVTTSTPAAGATAVSTSTAITATFGKAVVGSTVRMALTDASGSAVPASSAFDGTTNTATLSPASSLNESATYTVTVSGAADSTGVPMAAPYSYSFTTGTSPACPCTIFTPAATPAVAAAGDAKAVELGVKFKVDRGGYVTGVRFYKGSTNTGAHVGSLWSATGTLLARATFGGESASGWQQVNFSPHVLVSAGVTYVASYHTNVGRYSYTTSGLAAAVDVPPMHAPGSGGADGANGVYQYAAASIFPTTAGSGTNYYVDAVFDTAPMVIARSPFPGATNVATSSTITARFSEPVGAASIAFSLVDDSNIGVPGTTSYNATTQTATFTPNAPLSATTTYTATVAGATDAAGGVMTAPYTWSFSTVVLPPAVTSTTPASGGTAGSLSAPITATFGQSVAAASIQFSLTKNGQSVPGALSYDAPTHVMRFQPGAPLDQLQSFTATVSGATNAFGNSMAAPYSWSFTTPQAPPTVVLADPSGDNASQVDFNVTPSVTFSQAVSPGSVQMAVVDQDGHAVAGTQTFDASTNRAKFTPSALFNPSTKFTVTVSGATNYGGVPMAAPFTFSFTTAAPQVELTARTPGVNATDVALAGALTATFSQAIVPASVSFIVRNSAGTSVPGALTFLDGSTKARFAPNAPLAAGAVYTVTVSGAATADGQKMPVPVSWSFTTTRPPTLSSKTPAAGATGVPLDASASFDRAVVAGSTSFRLVDPLNQPVPGNATLNADGAVATFAPTGALASEMTYTVTVSGATSLGGAVMTAPVSWSFTTASRPTVTSLTPPANANGVAVTTAVTAGFNQAVTGAVVTVTDPAGAPVSGSTAYNASTNLVSFAPSAPLNAATPYAVTVTGATGSTGSTMLPYTWSFTTVSYGCPCTLMAPSATPATAAASDAKAVELGVKFQADVNGYISGVRFYKGTTNTGVHIGSLWTSAGAKLATVTFSGESSSGWQQATFSAPVPVTAGTTYVVSYHTNVGRYSYTTGVFSNGGAVNSGPLHAPTASNGVFLYGANSIFPSSPSTTGVNYFVDAVFTTAGSPNVTATTPANGATGVGVSPSVTARFDSPMQSAGLAFTLVTGSGANVPATVSLDPTGTLATLTPSGPLTPGVTYPASVRGKDVFGNQMVLPFGWSFTT
jgi:methionine-rich copper-binding protein CopC